MDNNLNTLKKITTTNAMIGFSEAVERMKEECSFDWYEGFYGAKKNVKFAQDCVMEIMSLLGTNLKKGDWVSVLATDVNLFLLVDKSFDKQENFLNRLSWLMSALSLKMYSVDKGVSEEEKFSIMRMALLRYVKYEWENIPLPDVFGFKLHVTTPRVAIGKMLCEQLFSDEDFAEYKEMLVDWFDSSLSDKLSSGERAKAQSLFRLGEAD